ncbi:bifunctional 2',3'-cyclic-nucleotide 2'-phosphodiesterase/3'-nucleotidase [uncultured Psychromonas sp.]|uniref:bifunctional 2',3'-cyclic-nucleotide 2'-phosphodiesterase/3'-nucleotidase n=1 Tax=uncultured Psychromonas sp. TaxID=173974 RepID=UPI00262B896A|nr:bifunctional 2',3'-cyclic-nucleotide 2'-phosphodiesterase/3'-nucleotidase [uncultured Psychromonas sp.]
MLNKTLLAMLISSAIGLQGCNSNDTDDTFSAQLRVLETSDIHANVMDYDYYQTKMDITIGLARTASLIKIARSEVDNTLLVDNGDLLQGSPMGDYIASEFNDGNEFTTHPTHKAMNLLDYEVGNIGNHEFNYGLSFLEKAINGANFPYINANVYCQADCWNDKEAGDNLFTPYLIKKTLITDNNGEERSINIGYIGFVPPQILQWDKQNLDGKVTVKGIVETAEKFIPEMQAAGADIIIAIPHSGIGSSENPSDVNAENASYALTTVDGIDAIMFGHSHSVFPSAQFADVPNVDIEKGLINGIPAVMPGRWGDNLGVIDFDLTYSNQKWTIKSATSESRQIYARNQENINVAVVDADKDIQDAVAIEHAATLEFVNAPIGKADSDMYSYLTLVQDDPTVQIVSNAQMQYVKDQVAASDNQSLKGLPVLSAAAPFKAGGRHSAGSDADSYVQVPSGDLTYKNAADLYLYPNTVVALKVTGAQLQDWLECSVNQFNQIDKNSTEPQYLINWQDHRTYNFDVIDGVTYKVDVTQASKFDGDCAVINPNAQRIVDLTYTDEQDNEITGDELAAQEFIIATNNYRAFGGKFAGTGSNYVVMEQPDTNRDVLAAYITSETEANGTVDPSADNNWDFLDIDTSVILDVRFETQNSETADSFIATYGQRSLTKRADSDELGFAVYNIDLTPTIK